MPSIRRTAAVLAAVLVTAGIAVAAPAQASPPKPPKPDAPDKVVSAYFTDWSVYGRGYFVKDIPADKLNVIQYAFGDAVYDPATGNVGCNVLDPWADYQQVYWGGENSVDGQPDDFGANGNLYGNFNQLKKLKAAHPHLKVEISLGGWTKSKWFSTLASTAELRQKFAAACIDTFIKGNLPTGGWPEDAGGLGVAAGIFDGIDLDWEYPTAVADGNYNVSPADRRNATLLAAEFRKQLDAYGATTGKHYLLTAALPAATSSTRYYELKAFVKHLDWANIMTYDFNVASSPVVAHNTLFTRDPKDPNAKNHTWNTVGTVAYYLANGVPANKIVVGVPFYGQQYLRTGSKNNGLYTPFDNTGLDPNQLVADVAVQPSFHALVEAGYVSEDGRTGGNGYQVGWNKLAGEPYLYSAAASHPNLTTGPETVRTFIAYSSPASIGERTALIEKLGLRGAMAWELSQDSDSGALISALAPILE
ncbi:glycoside hydrolase family 18 protein [Microbacterium sp. NPDC019599]|uniref:glycoside hydrolase family 18 protein n=1 Tax=Microbacterium sp. NPDC019599 TaxID=3154690 RepID=UPI0033E22663